MKREIIRINEEKCTGCGSCVNGCPEGALQIINGKARVVSDLFCDGLGACIGDCPEEAIEVELREAEQYNERRVIANIAKAGPAVIRSHLQHLREHGQQRVEQEAINFLRENKIDIPEYQEKTLAFECSGSMRRDAQRSSDNKSESGTITSGLRNWPIQLRLLNPKAPILKNAAVLVVADCVPFSYPNFHERFLKDKALTIFCPKLDNAKEVYVDKLVEILQQQDITLVSLVYMEVPCCSGVMVVVQEALEKAQKNIIIEEHTISVRGHIIESSTYSCSYAAKA